MRIFKNAWFSRFARKEKISAQALMDAVALAERGLIDADLGSGVIKQRIARAGQGKSGGYRTVALYRKSEKAFFVFGYPKNVQDSMRSDELYQFKRAAKAILALSDEQIRILIENDQFEEVSIHG